MQLQRCFSIIVFLIPLCSFAANDKVKVSKKKITRTKKDNEIVPPCSRGDSGELILQTQDGNAAPKKVVVEQKKSPFFEHEKIEDVTSEQIKKPNFSFTKKNGEMTISGKYRPEVFGGKNLTFLNANNCFDRLFFFRHTLDLNLDIHCGAHWCTSDAAQLKFTLRNKGNWGDAATIAPTSDSSVRLGDAIFGSHSHSLGKHVIWIREAWLKTSLNAVFRAENYNTEHFFLLGFYPFSVGHGIALGDAFAVNPSLVSFYTDNVVDQYAPGLLFTGDIMKDRVQYDLYGAIIENKSGSIRNNMEPVYFQRYCRRLSPERGFGAVNWLIAGRIQSIIFHSDRFGKFEFEPYLLYNSVPEQKVEFPADAESKLVTTGFDIDYNYNNFGCSFEFAKNFGHQHVFGWDSNTVDITNRNDDGALFFVNKKVAAIADGKPAPVTAANQEIINSTCEAQSQNGKDIGGGLRNSSTRFTDPYTTRFTGWMIVADMGYWILDKQIQLAAGMGLATGDKDPDFNFDNPKAPLPDGSYDGFIGLQEVFTGGRVESAYVLGQRRLARPLSVPDNAIQEGFLAQTISEFTNMGFAGVGLHVKPKWSTKFYMRPNLMFFWQVDPTRAFDLKTHTPLNCCARNFLGTEMNVFMDVSPLDCLKGFLVMAFFLPGTHYKDIQGLPITKQQLDLLRNVEVGQEASLPLLGTDPVFTINMGLEYRF
jgi:hypothetical protein